MKSGGKGNMEDMITTEEETFDNMTHEEMIRSSTKEEVVDEEKGAEGDESTPVPLSNHQSVMEANGV